MAEVEGKVVLRKARPEDAERIGQIAVAAWKRIYESYRKLMGDELYEIVCSGWQERKRREVLGHLESSPETTLVAEYEGKVVGFLTYRLDRGRGMGIIGNNAVDPDYQNMGIGTMLCRKALEIFRSEGMRVATVFTGLDEGHAPARRMYQKAGFNVAIPHVTYYLKL